MKLYAVFRDSNFWQAALSVSSVMQDVVCLGCAKKPQRYMTSTTSIFCGKRSKDFYMNDSLRKNQENAMLEKV